MRYYELSIRLPDLRNIFVCLVMFCLMPLQGQTPIKVMVVTGGHDFDRLSFFEMFKSYDDVEFEEVYQPIANEWIENDRCQNFDVLVFYDMYDTITENQKEGYFKLIKSKKPMIFLHHSLVSYQNWPEFVDIVGGRYHTEDTTKASYYKHDEKINVTIESPSHPVVRDLSDFTLIDEVYGNCEIASSVMPLLSTDHPRSMPLLGWINRYLGHDIIYLQSGHGPSAFESISFRKILEQSIRWLTRRPKDSRN